MTNEKLKKILENHKHWWDEDCEGWESMRANLRGAYLYGADLSGAYLRVANLRGADLYGANLNGADLRVANLRGADLYGADLRGADLRGADLNGANLNGANLRGADLRGADLYGANLREANLREADFYGANLRGAEGVWCSLQCPCEGEFIAWKKVGVPDANTGEPTSGIAKLLIPADAKRLSATTEKCRADKAVVLEIQDIDGNKLDTVATSQRDISFIYEVGKTVEPIEPFDEDRWNECSSGIHFFIDREMAVRY